MSILPCFVLQIFASHLKTVSELKLNEEQVNSISPFKLKMEIKKNLHVVSGAYENISKHIEKTN